MTALLPAPDHRAEVVLGGWFGALLDINGVTHRGDWTPIGGHWGECRARCGVAALGYLTGHTGTEPLCVACWRPAGVR